jgi:hypothetical protein
VAHHVLVALTRENLDLALARLTQLEAEAREVDRQRQLPLERVCYEAQWAEHQFNAVEPENRLVAHTLERRWSERLPRVEALDRAYAEDAI